MWLSTAAIRIVRGHREHRVSKRAGWAIELYPVLVWIPLVVATFFFVGQVEIGDSAQVAGVALALAGALFAAWAMWSLARSYGVHTDVFEGHTLKLDGPFAVVRHPQFLGFLTYHVGASLALESVALLAVTAFAILPYTLMRIDAEERVLREAFGETYDAYASRVPRLVPLVG
jgi:protein-S-isoprenylcysteine O-methyltransferase Ste14